MPTLLRLRRVGHVLPLVLLLGLASAPLRAEDDEEAGSPWLPAGAYALEARFVDGTSTFQAWASTEADAAEGARPAWVLLREQEGEVREAYDLTRHAPVDAAPLLSVRRRSAPEEQPGTRVAEVRDDAASAPLGLAQAFLQQLLVVEPLWLEGARQLREALDVHEQREAEVARRALREATRTLERAQRAAPWHLGVTHDLLVAYQVLLPYEVGTDRGANISFLWRERCTQWLSGQPDVAEQAEGLLCQVCCHLAEGCLPRVAALIAGELLLERDDLEPVRKTLQLLGQTAYEAGEPAQIEGPRGSVWVTALTCPDEPRSAGLPWQRCVFLLQRDALAHVAQPVWFSLSREGEADQRRWALVGWVGGSRRLLRLYGPEEPPADEVKALVHDLVQRTADAGEAR